MKKFLALLTASILVLAPCGGTAVAEPPETGSPPPQTTDGKHGGKLRKLLGYLHDEEPRKRESYGDVVLRHSADLKLSDEQIGKIVRTHQDNQQRIEELGKKIREARKAAYRLFLSPEGEEAAIRKAARDHTAAFDELVETALKNRAAINAVLTPEQLNQLKSFKP